MPGEFIDTNVVIYSLAHDAKQDKAIALLARQPVISVQVLSETVNIMRRKLGFESAAIRAVVNRLSHVCGAVRPLTLETLHTALSLAERYSFSHYDSLIVAAALLADCDTLFSEDMQHGQAIDGRLVIVNPFL